MSQIDWAGNFLNYEFKIDEFDTTVMFESDEMKQNL